MKNEECGYWKIMFHIQFDPPQGSFLTMSPKLFHFLEPGDVGYGNGPPTMSWLIYVGPVGECEQRAMI